MKILVTGSGGMVGRNIMEHLAAGKYEILSPRRAELNLADREATLRYLKTNRPEMIIHAAGRVAGIQANILHPVEFLVENLDINRNLIGSAMEVCIPKLINIGSSCMYPCAAVNPLREEMILTGEFEPTNEGYAIAKTMAARFCGYIRREYPELKYKTIIPCNLFGRHDKFDPKVSHMIPAVIRRLHQARVENRKIVEIWGDGSARREFMEAADLADFIFTAVERFDDVPDLMNVGWGIDHSMNDYYQAIASVVGYNGEFVHDLSKPIGMKQKVVSVEKLARFGWKPKFSLEDGIRRAFDFYLETEPSNS